MNRPGALLITALTVTGMTGLTLAPSADSRPVTGMPSTTTLTLSKHSIVYGDSLSGTVRVPAADGGDAVVRYGTTRLTVPIGADHDGRFSIAGGALTVGTDEVTARYSGTGSVAPSPTVSSPVEVAKAPTTVSQAVAPTVLVRGDSVNVHYAVHGRRHGLRPGGRIVLVVATGDAERRITLTVPDSGQGRTTLTLRRTGRSAISFHYRGDSNYTVSRSRAQTVRVHPAPMG